MGQVGRWASIPRAAAATAGTAIESKTHDSPCSAADEGGCLNPQANRDNPESQSRHTSPSHGETSDKKAHLNYGILRFPPLDSGLV